MRENIEFNGRERQSYERQKEQPMKETGSTQAGTNTPFQNQPYKAKKSDLFSTIKKVIYFSHFVIIAIVTSHILIMYPHARQFSFTLCSLIIFGYMAIWTIIVNFLFLSAGKENWAVMFDRLFIKFFMMLWPIFAIISYVKESFLNINEVAYLSLYLCVISLVLVVYELFVCIFAETENPEFIFEKNDLTISDDIVWNQRKLYNENLMKKNKFNIDA